MEPFGAWLAPLGAVITLALGLLGCVAPMKAAAMVGLSPRGPRGLSELRATYGGLFAGLGLACLLWPEPAAYAVAGLGWWGAGVARAVSIAVDRNLSWLNAGGVLMEVGIGALLWTGAA